jgi:hypothetical protein
VLLFSVYALKFERNQGEAEAEAEVTSKDGRNKKDEGGWSGERGQR